MRRRSRLLVLLLLAACSGPTAPRPPTPRARALLARLPPPWRDADLANGERGFSLCRTCHVVLRGGANLTGPNLYGVFGRRVAAVPDYAYSPALRSRSFTWDAPRLDAWLKGPAAAVPGTKMAYPGIADARDRRDVVAYLALASAGAFD